MKKKRSDGLVYSTGPTPRPESEQKQAAEKPSGSIEAVLRIEKKGRGGKTVTIVEIRGVNPDHAKQIGKKLKNACGVGGTTKGTVVELQGDQRENARKVLSNEGLHVRGA